MPNLATIMKEIKKKEKPDLLSYFSEIMVTNNKNPGSVDATAGVLLFPPDGEKLQ